jgi:glycerol-3-phosphate acyltransferase PlsX
MRIAVDVMGGDQGPGVVVDGVRLALQAYPHITEIHLVGQKDAIETALKRSRCRDERVRILHASEIISMEDKPLEAVRKKKDCSMVRAVELVRDGKAEAIISPGNTGALVATATFRLRRLDPVERAPSPPSCRRPKASSSCWMWAPITSASRSTGAICRHRQHLFARAAQAKKPRVAILSNGSEETKGNELTRESARLCRQLDLNFTGYVEGHDLFADHVDVVVTDGFVGNILLKSVEGLAKALLRAIRRELTANPVRKFGAALAQGAFRNIKRRLTRKRMAEPRCWA